MRKKISTQIILIAIAVITRITSGNALPIDTLFQKQEPVKQDTVQINALLDKSKNELYSDSKASMDHAIQALELSLALKFDLGKARSYNLLGVLSDLQGMNAQAESYYLKAISIFERIGNSNGMAKCYTNLGNLCSVERNIPMAIQYYEKSLSIQEQRKDTLAMANVYTNLGAAYYRDKAYFKALHAYQQSQHLVSAFSQQLQPDVRRTRLSNLTNIALVHIDLKNNDEAESNLQEALTIARSTDNRLVQSYIYVTLAELSLSRDWAELALEYAKAGLAIARQLKHRRRISELYHIIARAYEQTGDFKNAFTTRQLYIALSDSLKDTDNKSKIEKQLLLQSISKKSMEVKMLESRHRTSIFQRNIFIIIAILCIAILLQVFIRARLKQKLENEKQAQMKSLQEQELRQARKIQLEKSELLEKLNSELELQTHSTLQNENEVAQFQSLLKSHLITPADWDAFRHTFEKVNPLFFDTLRYRYPEISGADMRLCACLKLRLSLAESASMLGISVESIKQSRYRLKKKLNLHKEQSLQDFINGIQ